MSDIRVELGYGDTIPPRLFMNTGFDFEHIQGASHYEKPAREISKELTFLLCYDCLTVLPNLTYNVTHGVELQSCLV